MIREKWKYVESLRRCNVTAGIIPLDVNKNHTFLNVVYDELKQFQYIETCFTSVIKTVESFERQIVMQINSVLPICSCYFR